MKKIFKQFFHRNYERYNNQFVYNSGNGWSKSKDELNLFGWDDDTRTTKYTNTFRLELIYD